MAVLPMDLQVLFMQESKVARESDKARRHGENVRDAASRKFLRTEIGEIDDIDTAEGLEVSSDGSGGGGYHSSEAPEEEETEVAEESPSEEGKGGLMDFQA